ncbi:gem-associated protein 2 [Artemisia annua]|uniref:Gem-associated protein 2 n=1 Tax=Artemisia annua TaxID=35608 RepID=A0A2U1KD89_ARTAN|nr:gem-associated protein 2 [Artemisia annua]
MAESSSTLEPNPSIINPIQHTIDSHSHSHMGMIPEYTNNTHLQELGQNSDTHITNLTDSPQFNENKNMGFVGNCNIDNTQITNFTDFTKSDPLYGQKVEINDTQMTSVADLAESDPLYGQEAQKNDTQMTDFTDLPKSDSFNGRKREKNEGLVGNVKKEKRVRKRGKGAKKDVVCDFERVTVCDCDKRGDRVRVAYLKDEIEALRYVGVEEQRKKWSEVYCGLGDVVAKEYDCLVGFKDDGGDGSYVDFDPRTRFSNKNEISGNEPDNKMQNTNQMDHLSGGDLDVEEDYYEDEYSDSEDVSIQRPAFYVTGEPDFDSGPPQDGLEYLRRVRWETSHIPKVKVAKVEKNVLNKEQTVYMPNIPDIAACPEHLMPSKEWEDVFLADFSKLRLVSLSFLQVFRLTVQKMQNLYHCVFLIYKR